MRVSHWVCLFVYSTLYAICYMCIYIWYVPQLKGLPQNVADVSDLVCLCLGMAASRLVPDSTRKNPDFLWQQLETGKPNIFYLYLNQKPKYCKGQRRSELEAFLILAPRFSPSRLYKNCICMSIALVYLAILFLTLPRNTRRIGSWGQDSGNETVMGMFEASHVMYLRIIICIPTRTIAIERSEW